MKLMLLLTAMVMAIIMCDLVTLFVGYPLVTGISFLVIIGVSLLVGSLRKTNQ
ncbi:MAG TPA: hypothetical protein H9783_04510 [Candidatus Limosilactobacillus faecipullorum]|nr:hypothetical protein [Candidatus Limosilactobacillus faecipullorum]